MRARKAQSDTHSQRTCWLRTTDAVAPRPILWCLVLQVMGDQEGAVSAARQGCGLGNNLDVAVCRAEWLFHQGAYQAR